ncbi:T9SS type A sorting domain-containing protein [bacterium]|nr:T9SS type A sorting domain-containing protein [bacterium]
MMKTKEKCFPKTIWKILTVFIFLIIITNHLLAQGLIPNPIRAVVSEELEEPWEIIEDGGFEFGEHHIQLFSPYEPTPSVIPVAERIQEDAHTGIWSYRIDNTGPDSAEFSVWINPDKAEDVTFSCWVKSYSEDDARIYPFILFETTRSVYGPVMGDFYTAGDSWKRISLTASTTHGFRFAHAGVKVPPGRVLLIDDVSVTVPVWKQPAPTGTVIGGVSVPASPIAPVQICFSIHIEDPQNLIRDESFFWEKTTIFLKLAALFHAHGGYLNIQPELEWALASEQYAPDTFSNLASDYNATFSTHTHGPVCKDPNGVPYGSAFCQSHPEYDRNITEQNIADYIQIRREKFESLSGISVMDHNGNFDMVHKNRLHSAGVRTLSVFKSKYTQKTYDYLITNPWRPSDGDALADLNAFLIHNPNNDLIYIPGVGSNMTKRHERVNLKVRRFAGQFIRHADPKRVNAMNLVLHVDAFLPDDPDDDHDYIVVEGSGDPLITYSDAFVQHLQCWDDMLAQTIDPLVQAGYLQWATHAEIAEDFIAWEAEQAAPDSILTHVPSPAGGESGIAVLIRLPDHGRFGGHAPVVVHVPGGFNGEGMSSDREDLTKQGFVVLFFNFPGSGRQDALSGGVYDQRGPLSVEALRDVIRFAMGQIVDMDGNSLSSLTGSVIPLEDNVGLIGWSNGGNATLSAAGKYAEALSDLAWIVNWESPVGDGMPTCEAGAKGGVSRGNPETNPAYDPDTGVWDMAVLQYDPAVNINQHHSSNIDQEMPGGFYFDMNSNGAIDENVDYVPSPITMVSDNTLKAFYSERITNWAWNQGLFPANPPDHLTAPEACADFWEVRNGENWFDPVGMHLPDLLFMVVASEEDHAQSAIDHPHVLIQYQGMLNSGIALSRLNPDRAYIESLSGISPKSCVDNEAGAIFDHMSIRTAVQPADIRGLNTQIAVTAGCCELADRVYYQVLSPQLKEVITGPVSVESENTAPEDFALSCYPNPFNPGTTVRFRLPYKQKVCLCVFDMRGREVAVLHEKRQEAGEHTVFWNAEAEGVGSGVYLIRLRASGIEKTRKALYVK